MRLSSGTHEPHSVPHFRRVCSCARSAPSRNAVAISFSETSTQTHTTRPRLRLPCGGLVTGASTQGRYSWVHLRYGLLSCCLKTHDPVLPRRRFLSYRGVRTTPRTGLQPARLTAVTANGQASVSAPRRLNSGGKYHHAATTTSPNSE